VDRIHSDVSGALAPYGRALPFTPRALNAWLRRICNRIVPVGRTTKTGLDSEGYNERALFEQQPLAGRIAGARASWKRELESRNNESVLDARVGSRAPTVFTDKRDGPDHDGAVVASAHARGRR
jgi:hypothetical protein